MFKAVLKIQLSLGRPWLYLSDLHKLKSVQMPTRSLDPHAAGIFALIGNKNTLNKSPPLPLFFSHFLSNAPSEC